MRQHASGRAPLLHGRYPVSSLVRAPPTPGRDHRDGYAFPPGVGASASPRHAGSPGFLSRSLGARCPQPPRGARRLLLLVASPSAPGFASSERLAGSHVRNEAESGLLVLRLTPSPSGASTAGLLRTPPGQLHVERAIHMAGSFHPARSNWASSQRTGGRGGEGRVLGAERHRHCGESQLQRVTAFVCCHPINSSSPRPPRPPR